MAASEDPRLRLAYDEGRLALTRQSERLETLRERSTRLLTVAAVAATVTGGFALPHRGARCAQLLLFGAGLGVFVVLAVLVCVLLWPITLTTENDSRKLVHDFIEPGHSMNDILKLLAVYAMDTRDENAAKLERLFRTYIAALVALGTLVVLFSASAAVGAAQ